MAEILAGIATAVTGLSITEIAAGFGTTAALAAHSSMGRETIPPVEPVRPIDPLPFPPPKDTPDTSPWEQDPPNNKDKLWN